MRIDGLRIVGDRWEGKYRQQFKLGQVPPALLYIAKCCGFSPEEGNRD